jgi:transposase
MLQHAYALLSARKALLKKTMDLANEVRGLLKIFGVRLPKTVKHVKGGTLRNLASAFIDLVILAVPIGL